MKKFLSCLLALLGMNAFSSCNGTSYKEASVPQFADLAGQPGVQLVDVRTTEEFAEDG